MSDSQFESRPGGRARPRWPWVLTLLLIVGVGLVGYALRPGEAPAEYRTATVEIGSVEHTVTALGRLKPRDYVDVGTQVSGQLKRVHVEIGDRVEAGQLLAEIDPTVYETRVRNDRANLDNLRAQLKQQQAELVLSRRQLERNQRLLEASAVSRGTVEENEAAVAVNEARINATRAQIKAAEAALEGDLANLSYTRIHAPMAGTVVAESAVEGQTVNASQSAPVIVRVADLDTMTVWAQVAEADVVKVKPGLPVYFTTLGMPDRKWRGEVRQLLPTPEVVNDVVLYNVLIDVDNHDGLLMTEMTVQVFFLLGEARDVTTVPTAALSPAGRGYRAQVLTARGVPEERQVQVGVTSRTRAEVIEGLAVGEQVILGGGGEDRPRRSMGARL